MKKYLILPALMALPFFTLSQNKGFWGVGFDGLSYSYDSISNNSIPTKSFALFPSVYLGRDVLIAKFTEDNGLTLAPTFGIGGVAGGFGISLQFFNSTHLIYRHGFSATKDTGKDRGFGAGLGYRFSAGVIGEHVSYRFITPSLKLEHNFYSDLFGGAGVLVELVPYINSSANSKGYNIKGVQFLIGYRADLKNQ